MNRCLLLRTLLVAAAACTLSLPTFAADAPPAAPPKILTAAEIAGEAQKSADAQIAALRGRAPIDWVAGTLWLGLDVFGTATHNAVDLNAVTAVGEKTQWTPVTNPKSPFSADNDCISQAFLDVYDTNHDHTVLAPVKARFDRVADHLNTGEGIDGKPLTWWWCDALFMAPAGLAHLSATTGDRKYLDAMDKEYWRTYALLYSPEEHLFFRDATYLNRKSPNGKPVFWARGNGWVMGGLANLLTYMPADYPSRPRYVALFREMSAKIATLQGADGLWRSNLLDPAQFPGPETSGTTFYCYAMAWGIDHSILDRATYEPIVARAWAGILAARRPDGLPGYVQSVGAGPAPAYTSGTQLYATGGLLLAATELMKLAPLAAAPAPTLPVLVAPPRKPKATATTNTPTNATAVPQPAPDARAFVRYVPERYDDIAWENGRIAFRVYGPALQAHPGDGPESGMDVWVKSTRRMVVNDWYKRNDYHNDHGEGLDCYEVGPSRGDGGIGVWNGKKLAVSLCWTKYKILQNGPDAASFQMDFAPYDAFGRQITESRITTLPADSNLNRIETTLTSDTPGDLTVAIGIAKRPGAGSQLIEDKAQGILGYWEPPTRNNGTIGLGVIVDPALVTGFAEDADNYLMLIKVKPGVPFVRYVGACWSKGLDFHTSDAWFAYLKGYARK